MTGTVVGSIDVASPTSTSGNGPAGRQGLFREHGQVVVVVVAMLAIAISGSAAILGQIGRAEDRLAERMGRIELRVEKIADDLADTREQVSYIRGAIDGGADRP